MRSISAANGEAANASATVFTGVENAFRNPKLRGAALVVYKAGADAASKGVLLAITLVAARRLTPFDFGIFALGTTVGWMLTVAADCGIQLHLARAVARRTDAAPHLLERWWRVRLATTAGALLALAAALAAARVRSALALPLLMFALAYAATGLVELLNYYYRGLGRSDIESSLTIGQRAATLALATAALVWRGDVTSLAMAMLMPAVAALIVSHVIARRQKVRLDAPARFAEAADAFRRDVFPIGIGIVLSAVYFRLDVLLVQAWSGTEAVAAYNAMFRVIDALRLFPAAVLAVALPALCRATTLRPLRRIALWLTAFAVVVAAALVWSADSLVPLLFGARYAAAASALRILALAFPLLSLNFALTHQLVAWDRQRTYAAVCAAALLVNVGLNAWLIPLRAIDGAAWATLGTELCVTAGCLSGLRART